MRCRGCDRDIGVMGSPAYQVRLGYNELGKFVAKEVNGYYCTECMKGGLRTQYKDLGDRVTPAAKLACIRCAREIGTKAEPAYEVTEGRAEKGQFLSGELIGYFCAACLARGGGKYFG